MTLRDDYEHWARSFVRRMGDGWGDFLDRIGDPISPAITPVVGNYTPGDVGEFMECSASSGAFTVTMPTASEKFGRKYWVKKIDSSANAVTIDGAGVETIDDAASFDLEFEDESVTLMSNGENWRIV